MKSGYVYMSHVGPPVDLNAPGAPDRGLPLVKLQAAALLSGPECTNFQHAALRRLSDVFASTHSGFVSAQFCKHAPTGGIAWLQPA